MPIRRGYAGGMCPSPVALPSAELALTLVIADDHPLVRDGLKLLIEAMLPKARILEAGDAEALWRLARGAPTPDLALVDLNMPGMERGARLAALTRDCPRLPLVVVSALTSPDVQRRALDLPTVHAFVPKSGDGQQMRSAIAAALSGCRLAPLVTQPADLPPHEALTPRMQEIRALLRQGLSNKHIARQLNISEGTVKNYMTEIFRLLNVSNRTQAAQYDAETA